ncbi:MAG: DegT/DnrJ/EryC1/StrS family aminotransferase, partial [Flavitalea sp.]
FNPTSEYQTRLGRILLVADAAHSIGALYNGASAALMADVTIFSFHAVKNITTAEGGCVCLNLPMQFDHNAEYKYLKMYTLNGQNKTAFEKQGGGWKYDILFNGLKINMPDICAAIGLAQIRKYKEQLLPLRKKVALAYHESFKRFPWYVAPPLISSTRESSYHIFPLRIYGISECTRDQIIDDLVAKGISVNVHFIPMPMLTYFKELDYSIDDYPNSYAAFANEISLPIYPQMKTEEINFVIISILDAVKTHTPSLEKVY